MITTFKELLSTADVKKEPTPLKPIEFIRCWTGCGMDTEHSANKPSEWDNVILLSTGERYDLMYAWDNCDPDDGIVYLGHWNDGVK